jgi:hypothetical protein
MYGNGDSHSGCTYTISWRAGSENLTAQVFGVRLSGADIGVALRQEIATGSLVHVEMADQAIDHDYMVRDCRSAGGSYVISLRLHQPETEQLKKRDADQDPNHYEVLQISDTADADSIHRVFRLMAARFHPDNPETGDLEKFVRLTRAYEVLSNPKKRADYDMQKKAAESAPMEIFELKDFVVGVEAEENRRLGVLVLLYNQRRTDPDHPGVSLLDLERKMGLPREYLSFTMWYLRSKQFVVMGDNCDFALTADGADFVEHNGSRSQILSGLLVDGRTKIAAGGPVYAKEKYLRNTGRRALPSPEVTAGGLQ